MIEGITAGNLPLLRNEVLRDYAARYVDAAADFRDAVSEFGVSFVAPEHSCSERQIEQMMKSIPRARVCNDGKSAVLNWRSSACDVCERGIGTETFVLTLQCPHRCFFCFNPNQEDFDGRRAAVRDVCGQLEGRAARGASYTHLALTGGEPLLYPEESIAFVAKAKELFPDVHVRLYTSGFGASDEVLARLRAAGLDEVRFSVKTDAGTDAIERTLQVIASATAVIPDVLVEMPVMPDEFDLMKDLLKRLDEAGARGINLLELGFPFFNGPEFARRGYALKPESFRVLYDYAYAGGLPVDGSEQVALDLMQYAAAEGLFLGVHYCSMENKHTGQIYHQNRRQKERFPLRCLSERDYFLKSAKVFGSDRRPVEHILASEDVPFEGNADYDFTEFPLDAMAVLRDRLPRIEVGVSYAVCESRDTEIALREVRVDLATPEAFNAAEDW